MDWGSTLLWDPAAPPPNAYGCGSKLNRRGKPCPPKGPTNESSFDVGRTGPVLVCLFHLVHSFLLGHDQFLSVFGFSRWNLGTLCHVLALFALFLANFDRQVARNTNSKQQQEEDEEEEEEEDEEGRGRRSRRRRRRTIS